MKYFTVIKHTPSICQIKDALGSLSTILIGSEKALVFDTCYGIGDLKEEIRKITSLPLIVIDSHGHMDHTGGNYQFEEVRIHPDDYTLVKEYNSGKWRERNIKAARQNNVLPDDFDEEKYLTRGAGCLKKLDPSEVIDLGDLKAEIIEAPGHTKGSVALYCRKLKLMLVADAVCQYVWLFLKESTNLKTYIQTVKKLLTFDFEYFLVGHGASMLPKSKMEEYLNCALGLDPAKAKKVKFHNFEEYDSYEYSTDYLYSPHGCGIVFTENKLSG